MKAKVTLVVLVLLLVAAQAVQATTATERAGWDMPPVAEDDGASVRQPCGETNVLLNDWDPESGPLTLAGIVYTESLDVKWESDGYVRFCMTDDKRQGRLGYLVADDHGLVDVGYLYVYWL